jgi:hypothetical protein
MADPNCSVTLAPLIETKRKPKVRFDFDLLDDFVTENEITLSIDYTNVYLNREKIIEGLCVNNKDATHPCPNAFSKTFRYLLKHGAFCDGCMLGLSQKKIKQTCLATYGVDHPLKSSVVMDKLKQTNVERYGFENVFQNEEIKEKSKHTIIEKYGVENVNHVKEVRDKIKTTCLSKYGVEFVTKIEGFLEKGRKTTQERYGVDHASQCPVLKEKRIQKCLVKYGVEHPMLVAEIADKCSKAAYKLKDYVMPSGAILQIQGYENFALDQLLKCIDETDIVHGSTNVPEIWYHDDDDKRHRHYVDFYIRSLNKCIEVKSTWTAEKKEDNIFRKQNAAKQLGFAYEIWIYDAKGFRVELID